VVASKVHFTNNVSDMSEFIAPSKIPKELDGEDPWVYEYAEPLIGENPKMKDTATRDTLVEERDVLYDEYEQKTFEWLREKDAQKRAVIRSERHELAKKLRAAYWVLDPYVRARSLYDRVGVLSPDGKLNYSTWNKTVNAVNGTNGSIPEATASAPGVVETGADDVD
jgi:hypothetical protein